MSNFRTEIKIEEFNKKIEHHTHVMFLGSCFANNIGNKFTEFRLPGKINPFGVIYNPMSVANTLESIIHNKQYNNNELRKHNDLWLSFDHHSSFSNENQMNCLQKINHECHHSNIHLKNSQYIFITFGTAWVYQLRETKQIVSNCHKYPAKYFKRFILNTEEIVSSYKKLLTELLDFNPDLKIVFTVSPVRHWKDGAHGNQISKSTLLLAIDKLCDIFESCHYFPAYELMMDDLRDYRFYSDDMLHPNSTAVEYIWQKFEKCFFSSSALEYKNEMLKLGKALKHKSFNQETEAHQLFLKQQLNKIERLMLKYPSIDFTGDLNFIKTKIN